MRNLGSVTLLLFIEYPNPTWSIENHELFELLNRKRTKPVGFHLNFDSPRNQRQTLSKKLSNDS
jgi:hypothetical protein